jgi:hypothetical protein
MKTLMFVMWIGGMSADTASTHYALNQGAHETTLSQKPWLTHALIGGEAVGGAYGLNKLSKEHPKLAATIGIAAGAFRAGIAMRNMRVAQQMRDR